MRNDGSVWWSELVRHLRRVQGGWTLRTRSPVRAARPLEMPAYMTSWQPNLCSECRQLSWDFWQRRGPSWLICSDTGRSANKCVSVSLEEKLPESLPSRVAGADQDGFIEKFVHARDELWNTTRYTVTGGFGDSGVTYGQIIFLCWPQSKCQSGNWDESLRNVSAAENPTKGVSHSHNFRWLVELFIPLRSVSFFSHRLHLPQTVLTANENVILQVWKMKVWVTEEGQTANAMTRNNYLTRTFLTFVGL